MTKYLLCNGSCRHKLLMGLFGEEIPNCEQRCDTCLSPRHEEQIDVSNEAKIIIDCFIAMQRCCLKITLNLLQFTLCGSNSADIKPGGLDAITKFGNATKFNCPAKSHKNSICKVTFILIDCKILMEKLDSKSVKRKGSIEESEFAIITFRVGTDCWPLQWSTNFNLRYLLHKPGGIM